VGSVTPAAGALFGLGIGAGLWLLLVGWRGTTTRRPLRRHTSVLSRRLVLRGGVAVGVAVVVGAATGWPVAAMLAVAAGWYLPRILGPDRAHTARVAKLEAVATWAEMLRDTLAAAAGLEQAIIVTAPLVPDAISTEVGTAAGRLQAGDRLASVLRRLANELADPTADLVLSALVLAAEQRARNLGELLGSLAHAAREHAALQLRIHADRAQSRSDVRITVGATLAFALWLAVLDRTYLAAYNSPVGQAVLLLVGVLFGLGFVGMARVARTPQPARLFDLSDPTATGARDTAAGTGSRS
jgi:Flp pilus assembly protein TadB